MLLKIGTRYIETALIVQWRVGASESGKRELHGYSSEGRSVTITERAEIDALLRWLDAQATDIMATQPAPVGTPLPFKLHDRVRVLHSLIEDDKEFVGKVGRITAIDAKFDEIDVDFDGVEAMMISKQLELADTIPF